MNLTVKIEKFNFGEEETAISGVDLFKGAKVSGLRTDHPLFGKTGGVQVSDVEIGSLAWHAGLREDDVIVSANQIPVRTPDELERAARKKDKNKGLLLNIRRGNSALFIVMR